MLKRLAKRWVYGWLLIFNLWLTTILANLILFFALIPAIILLQAKGESHMNGTLRMFLVGLGIAYALIISPLTLPRLTRWMGSPVWTGWKQDANQESPPEQMVER